VTFLKTEFGPCFALCNAGIDSFFHDSGADPTCSFDTLAVVVEAIGYHCFGAVFVGGYDLRGEGSGVVEFLIVGPVRAAEDGSVSPTRNQTGDLTLLSSTCSRCR